MLTLYIMVKSGLLYDLFNSFLSLDFILSPYTTTVSLVWNSLRSFILGISPDVKEEKPCDKYKIHKIKS